MTLDTTGPDWRDGFLFVGDHLAIDFVNTRLLADGSMELLTDWPAVVRWLRAAGLIDDATSRRAAAEWAGSAAGRRTAERLREFREALRITLKRIEGGEKPSRAFLSDVNRMLREHPARIEIHPAGRTGFERRSLITLDTPEDAIAPLVDAAVSLVVDLDSSRIRQCEGCVAHFLDASKNGLRRWCSMRLCGNRAKVAAYALRLKERRDRSARPRRPSDRPGRVSEAR